MRLSGSDVRLPPHKLRQPAIANQLCIMQNPQVAKGVEQLVLPKQIFRIGRPAPELGLATRVSLVDQQAARLQRLDQLAEHLAPQEEEVRDEVIGLTASIEARQILDTELNPARQAARILPRILNAGRGNVRQPHPPSLLRQKNGVPASAARDVQRAPRIGEEWLNISLKCVDQQGIRRQSSMGSCEITLVPLLPFACLRGIFHKVTSYRAQLDSH